MNMSDRIKERRTALGMTQEELGAKLGLQKSAIAKYENGRVENIKRSVIQNMATILDCTPSYLMGWDAEYRKNDIKPLENSEAEDIELLNAYHSASDEIKSCIRRILGI